MTPMPRSGFRYSGSSASLGPDSWSRDTDAAIRVSIQRQCRQLTTLELVLLYLRSRSAALDHDSQSLSHFAIGIYTISGKQKRDLVSMVMQLRLSAGVREYTVART